MKILKPGEWRFTFGCEECKAFLMRQESDLGTRQVDAGGGGSIQIVCYCPGCKTIYRVPPTDIPDDVRSRVLNPRLK